jgi:hypothetical protein
LQRSERDAAFFSWFGAATARYFSHLNRSARSRRCAGLAGSTRNFNLLLLRRMYDKINAVVGRWL